MRFHLDFKPTISQQPINHQQGILLMGSCFSEHIDTKLKQLYFDAETNPFGIVFNPLSIEKSIDRIINKNYFKEDDIFEKNGLFFCLEAHSQLYSETKQGLLQTLNTIVDNWNTQLKKADWLLITFGSAYGYTNLTTNKVVANCHKLPQQLFDKKMFDANEIVNDYKTLIDKLSIFNPNLKLIFTVSPVKHLKDGVVENSLSKAVLLQSVHQLCNTHHHCFYFPAYELVNDDLRDYRFYKQDMAHPNEIAIDYVWQKFSETYFTNDTLQLNKQLHEINLAQLHKPLQPNSKEYAEFKSQLTKKTESLMQKHPWLKIKL